MKLNITRTCGHEERIGVFGSARERERREDYERSRMCYDCYAAEQRAQAAQKTGELFPALPALTGSEKQIKWATDIRNRLLAEALKRLAEHVKITQHTYAATPSAEQAIEAARVAAVSADWLQQLVTLRTDAKWWIDHRDISWQDLYRHGSTIAGQEAGR